MGFNSLEELRKQPETDIFTWVIRHQSKNDPDVKKAVAYWRTRRARREDEGLTNTDRGFDPALIGIEEEPRSPEQ